MSYKLIVRNPLSGRQAGLWGRIQAWGVQRPAALAGVLLAAGGLAGFGAGAGMGLANASQTGSELARHQQELEQVRRQSQQEINALAARLGELQAQANRLNALGERLTEAGQLEDGEFDFQGSPGQGGAEVARDMPKEELVQGLDEIERQFAASGRQLSVMESLLFDMQLEANAVPSRSPVRRAYITSSFGRRADPFGRGGQFHKGIDFNANVGDPVMAVADGVVSFADNRSGYGKTIEIDHGRGLKTRYAHLSGIAVRPGERVALGQRVGAMGSTGRSTGTHLHYEVWVNGRAQNPGRFLKAGQYVQQGD